MAFGAARNAGPRMAWALRKAWLMVTGMQRILLLTALCGFFSSAGGARAQEPSVELGVQAGWEGQRSPRLVPGRSSVHSPCDLRCRTDYRTVVGGIRTGTLALELRRWWSRWGLRVEGRVGLGRADLRFRRRTSGIDVEFERGERARSLAWSTGVSVGPALRVARRLVFSPAVRWDVVGLPNAPATLDTAEDGSYALPRHFQTLGFEFSLQVLLAGRTWLVLEPRVSMAFVDGQTRGATYGLGAGIELPFESQGIRPRFAIVPPTAASSWRPAW